MLRKKTRSLQKDQKMPKLTMSASGFNSFVQFDLVGQRQRNNSFFSVPGLLIGLNGLSDGDSVRSPTSPLEFRMLSSSGNSFRSQKSWDSGKVGLSIIESLDDNSKLSGEVNPSSSDSKNIVFGPQMWIQAPNLIGSLESSKSQPRNYAISSRNLIKSSNLQKGNSGSLFEIVEDPLDPGSPFGVFRSCSLDSSWSVLPFKSSSRSNLSSILSSGSRLSWENNTTQVSQPPQSIGGSPGEGKFLQICSGSGHGPIGSVSASEIELSEDYTCVTTHGPNPKTTHIYGDCILECHSNDISKCNDFTSSMKKKEQEIGLNQIPNCSEILLPCLTTDFLSYCNSCKKKLEGEDIFMYRGEKAFCSISCRESEIMIDEEVEETASGSSNSLGEYNHEDPRKSIFFTG